MENVLDIDEEYEECIVTEEQLEDDYFIISHPAVSIDNLIRHIQANLLCTAKNYDEEDYEMGYYLSDSSINIAAEIYNRTDDEDEMNHMYYVANAFSFSKKRFDLAEDGFGTDYWMMREKCLVEAQKYINRNF